MSGTSPRPDAPAFSVIVPVHNEAALLPETARLLLNGLGPAEVVFVCNGCVDGSAELLRRITSGRARVLELAGASKPAAIRAGEAATACFPRFYLDADVWIAGPALNALAAAMRRGGWELVSPRLRADTRGASRAAQWITEVWMRLPHMRDAGFHCLLGLNAAGRSRWGPFPDLVNDDDFIVGQIPPDRRHIVTTVTATIRPPATFRSWVRVRERWLRGQHELARLARAPRTEGQGRALLDVARSGRPLPVIVYLAARGLAWLLAARHTSPHGAWYRDLSSRRPTPGPALVTSRGEADS